jgi:hypothetical protein
VGQYRRSARSKPALIPAAFFLGLAVLLFVFWRVRSRRERWVIPGGAILVLGLLAGFAAFGARHVADQTLQTGIGIRREGDRLFIQALGPRSWPVEAFVPPITGELQPASGTLFFEALSGTPITFSVDSRRGVTGLTVRLHADALAYEKISDEAPRAPEPPKRPAVIPLEMALLDACAGRYEFPPTTQAGTGAKLAVWREGEQLLGQFRGEGFTPGAIDLLPESETEFVLKIDGAQLRFIQDKQGVATSVVLHVDGFPDYEGTRIRNDGSRP